MRSFKRDGRRGGVLAGCLIALGVVAVLVVIGGIIVAMNWRSWMASGSETLLNQAIDSAPLSEPDRLAMKSEVSTLMQDFRDEKVSLEQLAKVVEEVGTSPIVPAASVMFVESGYIAKSGLSEEEKAEGDKQLGRFARGVYERKIADTKLDDVLEPIAQRDLGTGDLKFRSREEVTDDDLRRLIANAAAEADAVGIPAERYDVNIAAEFANAIDRALGRPERHELETGGGAGGDSGDDSGGDSGGG